MIKVEVGNPKGITYVKSVAMETRMRRNIQMATQALRNDSGLAMDARISRFAKTTLARTTLRIVTRFWDFGVVGGWEKNLHRVSEYLDQSAWIRVPISQHPFRVRGCGYSSWFQICRARRNI
jgi:hypothetical protein